MSVREEVRSQLSALSFQPSFVRNPSFFVAGCGLLPKSLPGTSRRYTHCGWGFSSDSWLLTPDRCLPLQRVTAFGRRKDSYL